MDGSSFLNFNLKRFLRKNDSFYSIMILILEIIDESLC